MAVVVLELKDLKAKGEANSSAAEALTAGRQEAVHKAAALHAQLQRLEKLHAADTKVTCKHQPT